MRWLRSLRSSGPGVTGGQLKEGDLFSMLPQGYWDRFGEKVYIRTTNWLPHDEARALIYRVKILRED